MIWSRAGTCGASPVKVSSVEMSGAMWSSLILTLTWVIL